MRARTCFVDLAVKSEISQLNHFLGDDFDQSFQLSETSNPAFTKLEPTHALIYIFRVLVRTA